MNTSPRRSQRLAAVAAAREADPHVQFARWIAAHRSTPETRARRAIENLLALFVITVVLVAWNWRT